MTEFREGMTWLCLLSSTDARARNIETNSLNLGGQSLNYWCEVIWNPGIVGQQDICVCYDCICLMVWFHDMVLLIHVWTSQPVWTGIIPGNCQTITWELCSLCRLITPCDVDCLCAKMNQQFRGVQGDVIVGMTNVVKDNGLKRCVGGCRCSLVHSPVNRIPIRVIGRFGYGRVSVGCADWLNGCAVLFISAGGVRIGYIRSAIRVRCSTDATPVTGSLVLFNMFHHLRILCCGMCFYLVVLWYGL